MYHLDDMSVSVDVCSRLSTVQSMLNMSGDRERIFKDEVQHHCLSKQQVKGHTCWVNGVVWWVIGQRTLRVLYPSLCYLLYTYKTADRRFKETPSTTHKEFHSLYCPLFCGTKGLLVDQYYQLVIKTI